MSSKLTIRSLLLVIFHDLKIIFFQLIEQVNFRYAQFISIRVILKMRKTNLSKPYTISLNKITRTIINNDLKETINGIRLI